MAKISIKAILRKEDTLRLWLDNWCTHNKTEVCISDPSGKVVYGNPDLLHDSLSIPLITGDAIVARVWSKSNVLNQVWDVLNMLITKESEKRKLGAEVLHLYQELNIIYGFAESLGEAISTQAIAEITLAHSTNSIPADAGIITLWEEKEKTLAVPAVTGEQLFDLDLLAKNTSFLFQIVLNGQSGIITDIEAIKKLGLVAPNVTNLIYASLKGKDQIMGAIVLAGTRSEPFTAAHLKLLVTLALQSSSAIESALLFEKNLTEIRMREEAMQRINEVIKKFVPNEFISSLGKKNITDVRLGDQVEKIVTVLFTDIRDFTTLSERMSPEENFRFVSSFNEILGPIIREHKGFINQYLGDSIMAIFPNRPQDAVLASIGMQRAVRTLNRQRKEQGLPLINAGIGMHTGPLIMGITGDEHRLDAATISDTVNTASRIESLTKYYQSPLLMSEDTVKRIPNNSNLAFRRLGKVLLKGKNNALSVVECMNGLQESISTKRKENLEDFDKAMELYQQRKFENAIALFNKVLDSDPEDHTVKVFLKNAEKYLNQGAPKNWNGAEEMLYK
ncbi:adenylate/guanylate cyclase domain-containing protein [Algoriphagus sediminis]|uniref:Adenylate/guanylate cyclase domain-containing protein n=1 Tax=Algoriphagus sediminis TaxID=3057113 RepID=A0ABT7YC42_9BACT|nr:adenylate/guanylate cyclase domain-containing protein [Algoriphagus sediminis]MDN3204097.1 adenylate/guanylate cyclase domain-containing protein [Algoriphagus sediminis]